MAIDNVLNQFSQQSSQQGIQLPITAETRRAARHFASFQSTPERAAIVQLNTLAVVTVYRYCQMMDIVTDLEHSDSWNPWVQRLDDVADLILPDLGRLECRPVKLGSHRCQVPPEVWHERIGYLAVAIDADMKTAHLLGFSPAITDGELLLTRLQPLEDLVDYLHTIKQEQTQAIDANETVTEGTSDGISGKISNQISNKITGTVITLSQWFNQTLEPNLDQGWQTVEALLPTHRVAFSMRGEVPETALAEPTTPFDIRRAKLVDLAIQLGQCQVVILIELNAESAETTHIRVQLYPAQGHPYLPPGLELAILVPTDVAVTGAALPDTLFTKVESRQADECIRLQFNGNVREQFTVRMRLNQAEYSETFVV